MSTEVIFILFGVCIIFIIGIAVLFFIHQKKNKKLIEELIAEKTMLETVFNIIPDFVFCKDIDLRYTKINKRLVDYFGVRAEDIIGKDDEEGLNVPEDIANEYREMDRKVLREGRIALFEEFVPGADGTKILCETIKVPIFKNGKAVGLTGISRNISHRLEMEKNLKNAVEKAELEAATLKAIFDSIPDFIFCKDMNLKYTRCNKHMEDYFGVSEADLAGKDDADGLGAPIEMVQACNASDMKILETGQLTVSEEFVPGAGGALILCETIKVPIMQNGEIVGLTGVSRDVTERKANEEAAQAASRAKGEFLSRMSHEMRTPMNAIIGMTAIGKLSPVIEKKDDAFNKIESASKHLLGVINDILDMSKIEAGKLELSHVSFEFEKLLQNVVNVVNFRVEERRQALFVNIDKDIPHVLIGDDQRLSQVMTNLLSNAVKFTPEDGSIHLDSRLISNKDDMCRLQISVRDTGIGVSDEQKERLFQSFEQAENDTSRKYGGTGLGLAIAKRIVELMNGEIWVESEFDRGSNFVFTVLLKCGSKDQKHLSNENIAWGNMKKKSRADSEISDDLPCNNFTGHTILLAEDVEINREIVLALLEPTGLEIKCAENGAKAVGMFSDAPDVYDMIFMDVQMPEMDGFQATRKIRALDIPKAKTIPIIAMTANVFREDVEKCLESGMDGHLAKPLNVDFLFAVLNEYICSSE